jgi:hypothetical protein
MVDYSKGRYNVNTPDGGFIGRIDRDEFVRNGISLLYRIDGDEFYEVAGRFIGSIEDGVVRGTNGEAKFIIKAE